MKLESLKSSKFDAFKGSEITNAFAIVGGECQNTAQNGQIMDSVNRDTHDTVAKAYSCDDTVGHDWYDTACPTGPGTGQGGGNVFPVAPYEVSPFFAPGTNETAWHYML